MSSRWLVNCWDSLPARERRLTTNVGRTSPHGGPGCRPTAPQDTDMAPTPQLPDRRRFSRVPCDFPVKVEKVPKRSLADVENLLSEDLSEGGIRLSSPRFFSVQERMLLELDTPEEPGSIRTLGRVVWVEQSSYTDQFRLGVEFADLSELDRSDLRRIVEQQQVGT